MPSKVVNGVRVRVTPGEAAAASAEAGARAVKAAAKQEKREALARFEAWRRARDLAAWAAETGEDTRGL